MKIKILSDSCCDLTAELITQYDIEILNIPLANDQGEDVRISVEEMFRLQHEGHVFQTSQIGIYPYVEKFQALAKEGRDFIYLSLSSGLTGGYNNSLMALEQVKGQYPQVQMASVDTLSASAGQGLFVILMAKAAQRGAKFEELLELAEFLRNNITLNFTVLDMEHLYRGGRISRTQKNISRVLNLMPILKTDNEGKLCVHEVIRGKNKVNKKMIELLKKNTGGRDLSQDCIVTVYGEDDSIVATLQSQLADLGVDVKSMQIGAIIGTHVGPGVMGCAYLKEPLPEKYHD